MNRKVFVKTLVTISVIFGIFYYFDSTFQKQDVVFDKHYHNSETRMDVWKANLSNVS